MCRKRMLRTRRVSRVEGRRSGWRQLVVGPIVVPTNGTQKGALAIALRHEASEKLREHLWPVQTPSLPPLSSPIFSLKRQQLASNNCELRSWGCIATHGHITSGSAGREGTGGLQSSSPLALRGSCPCRGHHGRIVALLPETSASRDAVRVSPSPTSYSRSAVRGCLAMLEVLAAPPSSPTNSCRSSRLAIQRRTALSVLSSNLPSRCTKGEEGEVGCQRAKEPMAAMAAIL